MAKYFDSGKDFLVRRIVYDDASRGEVFVNDGSTRTDGYTDIELKFPGLVYNSFSGAGLVGKPSVYSESFAEKGGAQVYVPKTAVYGQPNMTLALYFFDAGKRGDEESSVGAAMKSVEDTVASFTAFVTGCKIVWKDTLRNRKFKLYLADAPTIKTDSPKAGECYIAAEYKFTSEYGSGFAMDYDDKKLLEVTKI